MSYHSLAVIPGLAEPVLGRRMAPIRVLAAPE